MQNQPDFQAGAVDHRTHFVNEVPGFVREAMEEYAALTGREYKPMMTFMCEDAEYVMVGLGSVTDDAEAVATHLRAQGKKVGVISIKLLQPFPEAEFVAAVAGKKAVTVLERSDLTALTRLVTQALFKARENADGVRHAGIPPLAQSARDHHRDLRPRRARPAAAPPRRRLQEHGEAATRRSSISARSSSRRTRRRSSRSCRRS